MKYALDTIKSEITEVQTGLHWYVEFGDFLGIQNATTMAYYVTEVSPLPTENLEHIKLDVGGHTINYVGKLSRSGTTSFTLSESTKGTVTKFLHEYNENYWTNGKGVQKLTNDMKRDVIITCCDPADNITKSFKLLGCLLKISSKLTLGQEANLETIEVEVTYDNFERTIGGSSSI